MDNPKTRRPRRTNKDLRNDIMNAASEVIKKKGFAKSSLMRIVNLAKVESTVFHRHFGDWKNLWTSIPENMITGSVMLLTPSKKTNVRKKSSAPSYMVCLMI